MSSPPLSEPGHRAGLLFQAAGSFVSGLALASGPGPGFASVRPRRIRLCNLAILSWPAVARGERIGGGPVYHARLTELECLAGPSAPRSSRHILGPSSLRAIKSVPSGAATRADVTAPHSCETVAPTSGSELALKFRSATSTLKCRTNAASKLRSWVEGLTSSIFLSLESARETPNAESGEKA